MPPHNGSARHARRATSTVSADRLKNAVSSQGGLRSAVAAVTRHVQRPAVTERALAVLCNIAQGDRELKDEVSRLGGFESIKAAMSAAPDNVAVQIQGVQE